MVLQYLPFKDLLTASEVSKFWRETAGPMIANNGRMVVRASNDTMKRMKKFSIQYKHMRFFVSFI